MAKNKKNINWRKIMTSDEAYTYTPPKKKKKSLWDKWLNPNPARKGYIEVKVFSKGGKVK
jgi:hypothetical protein